MSVWLVSRRCETASKEVQAIPPQVQECWILFPAVPRQRVLAAGKVQGPAAQKTRYPVLPTAGAEPHVDGRGGQTLGFEGASVRSCSMLGRLNGRMPERDLDLLESGMAFVREFRKSAAEVVGGRFPCRCAACSARPLQTPDCAVIPSPVMRSPLLALTQHSCHEVQSSGGQMPTDRTAS
jgi:hypothetical protein